MTNEQKNKIKEIIKKSNNIVFFGGAGVSTASGIPDFRSKDGLYNQHDVQFENYKPEELLDINCLHKEPNVFFEFYRQKMDVRNIEPNITHKVLAKMEKIGKLKAIVTQNIDGLHQKAGSKVVYEIHGTTKIVYCSQCGKHYPYNIIFDTKGVPTCNCQYKGIIRPLITLYGEPLPYKTCIDANNAIKNADCLIVAGTSLQVQPAANYIYRFTKGPMIVINLDKLDIMPRENVNLLEINEDMSNVFSYIDEVLEEIKNKNL